MIMSENQERMLFDIYREGGVEEKDVDDVLSVNYPNPWNTLNSLVRKGLVEEDPDSVFIVYILTPSGERIVEGMME